MSVKSFGCDTSRTPDCFRSLHAKVEALFRIPTQRKNHPPNFNRTLTHFFALQIHQNTTTLYKTIHLPPLSPQQTHHQLHTTTMSRHHPDLVMCRKQSGIAIGRLCDKCDGKCPVCDSYVRPTTLVRICDECSFGNYQNKCIVCGGEGISDAFYCFECTRLEKDRDGCPKIINLGSSRTDLFCKFFFIPGFSFGWPWLLTGFADQKKNFRNH
jgi:PHD finger-like domain-containing protein 5A